ncbi:MAG: hypothetical protein IJ537_08545 [Bacteroidaceae bacterium]|nr:hypothetical protein [Bacteroidaceae bacterium]
MKEGIIFIDKVFWKNISSIRERYTILDKLILSQSAIYTNFQKEEDTILDIIHSETGGRLYWSKDIKDYIDAEDIVSLSSIYLTERDVVSIEKKSSQNGIVIFNNRLFSTDKRVFSNIDSLPIDEDKRYYLGWKNEQFAPILSNNKCNSMIINDKYLCNKGYMNPDLKDILDLVLPKSLSIPFHLSIFSEVNSNGNEIYTDIINTIIAIRSQKFMDNTLFTLCYSTLHDRFIISNNYYISVGAGFALFNGGKKPKNSTSIKMYYPTAVGKKMEYQLWIKKTLEINERTINYWGDRVNRLFDLVK